ncbi:MAG: phosphoethanolamine transferase [Vicingaceae bacterium]|nr:phosphoethanolamine transferase [Vicingaceae bacterium]
MDLKFSFWLLILIPYLILFILTYKNPPTVSNSKKKSYAIIFLALVAIIFISENVINGRFARKGVPQIANVTYSFFERMILYKEAMQERLPKKIEINSNGTSNQQTFVLIIGESCSRRHMSIYGSKRITNPKLSKRKDIFKYTDVVSPYSTTLNSVLTIISNADLENRIDFDKSIDLIDVFHSAGFKTYWISNQSPIGIWDNLITILAKKSDYSKFVNISSNSSFEATYNSSYDSKLFNPFKTVLNENVDKKFIIIHLMGNHSSYSKRYPSDFNVFEGKNSKEETIAEYDNSMLYNDFIVDSLFNILKSNTTLHNNTISSAIYLSDHGENVYDINDRAGHDYANEMPQVNVEIPFLVWLSPSYMHNNATKTETIKININQPYVTDDLFHAIMDLNGIQCAYFKEEKSIFNEKFNNSRLRILEDGMDYDAK